jgi:hypothetical protein
VAPALVPLLPVPARRCVQALLNLRTVATQSSTARRRGRAAMMLADASNRSSAVASPPNGSASAPLLSFGQQQNCRADAAVSVRLHRSSVNAVDDPDDKHAEDLASGADWARWLGRWLGTAALSGKRWRYAINTVICCTVLFEVVWWGSVVYIERQQPGVCVAGAVLDATRGILATAGCGGGALIVSRAWLDELLALPTPVASRATVDRATRRWLIFGTVYVGLDTMWMLYRNIAAWPFSLLSDTARVRPSERTAIGSSNFVSGAILLSLQCAFIVVLASVSATAGTALQSIDVGRLSAAELVDEFREAKRQHDGVLRAAHGSLFLSLIVVYYLLNWGWVCFLVIMGELDQAQECIFMRAFGRRQADDDVQSVLVVAESLVRRLVQPVVLILIIGRLNNHQKILRHKLPMAWYKRDRAAAEIWLADRCLTAEPLVIRIAGWHMSTGQATALVGALLFWALGESAARWLFD